MESYIYLVIMSIDSIKFTSDYISDEDISVNPIIVPIKKPDPIPFWSKNPNVLFQSEFITEFFPVVGMSLSQSLNAITRSVIILSIIGFAMTRNWSFFGALAITMTAIHFYYVTQKKEKDEGFENAGLAIVNDPAYNTNLDVFPGFDSSNSVFDKASSSNPFSNVLLPDYDMNPNKRPAPPAGTDEVYQNIIAAAKQTVTELNNDQPDIADKLFKDLGENLEFEQSMRNFYSNPSTTIPNDQAAFAEFCYGSMISCKEGNAFACARNLERHTN